MSNPFELLNTIPSSYDPDTPGISYENDEFVAYLSARVTDGEPITYYISNGNLPYGTTLDPTTGVISGKLSMANTITNTANALIFEYTWYFTVEAYGNNPQKQTPQDFYITVHHINIPPVWSSNNGGILFELWEGDNISNANILNNSEVEFVANTLQLIGPVDPQNFPVTYSVDGDLPDGIGLTNTGVFTGQLPPLANNYVPLVGSIYSFVITANNGTVAASQNCMVQLNNVNVPPTWITNSGSIGSYPEFSPMSYQLQASDVDGNNLTYSIYSGGFEDGVTLSPDGIISGTPINPVQGSDNVCNAVISVANPSYFTNLPISVTFTNVNLPPVWTTNAGLIGTSYGGINWYSAFSATDPQNYPLTYSLTSGNLPPALTLSANGVISGPITPTFSSVTSFFTASVSNGYFTVPQNYSITILEIPDTPPVWVTPPGNIFTGYSGYSFPGYQLSATESVYAPQPLIYYLSVNSSLPNGLYINQNTGFISAGTLPLVNSTTQYNFTVTAYDGAIESNQSFSITVNATPHGTQDFTANGTFLVPDGVTQLVFTYIIAGGGGGGCGQQLGNGGGGSGGGSGGFYTNYTLAVNPSDVIGITIGQGGIGPAPSTTVANGPPFSALDGRPGGNTVITKNGVEIITATGGSGGSSSENIGATANSYPAGVGGSPNGITGIVGGVGTNDHSSCNGGNGAPGPQIGSKGGGGGLAGAAGPVKSYSTTVTGSAGGNGIGYGSAGGGGGSTDRTDPGTWGGGDGVQGFVEITW